MIGNDFCYTDEKEMLLTGTLWAETTPLDQALEEEKEITHRL